MLRSARSLVLYSSFFILRNSRKLSIFRRNSPSSTENLNFKIDSRFYSKTTEDEKVKLKSGTLESTKLMLEILEKGESFTNSYYLGRAPYFCSVFGLEDRFLKIVDRWWAGIYVILRDEKRRDFLKWTSIIFHLGKLNRDNDGVIMKKLGENKIRHLLDYATSIDFRTLPEREDVLSFLTGIRDLIREAGTTRIAYPNLKSSNGLLENLERYVENKSISGKNRIDQNQKMDEEYIFLITTEAMTILSMLRELEFEPTADSNSLLILLYRLSKEGLDYYYSDLCDRKSESENETIKFLLSNYAAASIHWRLDPDTLASESWRSWYRIYDRFYSEKAMFEASAILHHLNYLNYFPQVARQFQKLDHFWPKYDNWIADVRNNFLQFCQRAERSDTEVDRINCLTDIIFSIGQLAKYTVSLKSTYAIFRLDPIIGELLTGIFDYTNPKSMTNLALFRFLTGWRDYRSVKKSKNQFQYMPQFLDYINRYFASRYKDKLENIANSDSDDLSSRNISAFLILMRQLDFRVDLELWSMLMKLFERGFVCSRLFEIDRREFWLTLVNFGDACCYYISSDYNCKISDRVWSEYFFGAKLFLKEIDPQDLIDSSDQSIDRLSDDQSKNGDIDLSIFGDRSKNDSKLSRSEYGYFLGVILSVARRFDRPRDFESLKSIWQTRMFQVADLYDSRQSYLAARKMKALTTNHKIQFDQSLLVLLRDKGTDWAEELKRKRAA